ncbi:MAG TPA: beta-ketoacyl-[acyl-carrier-protein] synthase family protein [Verrucomicrobiae bacterium]|jgi:3-oxoacyl-[acyl-carrier-protein] synthase II|nr:beta-ketoacyl-[acyl-carrier-protein] synthase family protein [Verrucomicrobiae bacterium]
MAFKKRIVITGAGAITPIGVDVPSFWDHLKRGVCGIDTITQFNVSRFPVKRGFEVRGFHARDHGTHLLDPFIQYAVGAADEALIGSGLKVKDIDPYRIGMSVSSSKGGVHTIDRFGDRLRETPSAILGARVYTSAVPNFAAQWIARRWELQGAAKCYVAACATGTVAVIEGAHMISEGMIDYCIAGASDASLVPLMLAGYRQMNVMAEQDILPFDKRRDGFLVGEGAGVVLLETYESAKARGAKIYAEILGHGYGNDAGRDGVRFQESENALSRTVGSALKSASIAAQDVDYVNLHGTGTTAGDLYETRQMKHAFGARAQQIPMSSTKSMTGHMLGASGAVEIIACLGALDQGFLPPTANLSQPDPECDLDYVALVSRPACPKTVLSVSMGFGGHVAAIVLGKP